MKENLEFGKEKIIAAEYDNHDLHLDEHLKCLLEEKDERLKAKIDEHIKQHRMLKSMTQSANLTQEATGNGKQR